MEARDKAIVTLKKLYAKRVSVLGTKNEGELYAIDNAIEILTLKWDVKRSELKEIETDYYRFSYASLAESRILFQIIFQITQKPTISVTYRNANTRLVVIVKSGE